LTRKRLERFVGFEDRIIPYITFLLGIVHFCIRKPDYTGSTEIFTCTT